MPVNYQNGKVYKIVSDLTEMVYVGSTAEPTLARRLAKHMNNYRDYCKNPENTYTSSYEILQHGDARIILLETCPCNNKDELTAKEDVWIKHYKDVAVNMKGGVKDMEKRKAYVHEFNKQYYAQHREKELDRMKANAKIRIECECGRTITKGSKSNHIATQIHRNALAAKQAAQN